jgi:hypothetical protein
VDVDIVSEVNAVAEGRGVDAEPFRSARSGRLNIGIVRISGRSAFVSTSFLFFSRPSSPFTGESTLSIHQLYLLVHAIVSVLTIARSGNPRSSPSSRRQALQSSFDDIYPHREQVPRIGYSFVSGVHESRTSDKWRTYVESLPLPSFPRLPRRPLQSVLCQ